MMCEKLTFKPSVYLLPAAFYIAFTLSYISYYPLWDGFYFFWILKEALIKLNNLETFFEFFNLNGHPSMAYAGYLSIGQLISWDSQYILNIQNIILNVISGFCFLGLAKYFVGKLNYLESIFISSVYLFNPLINASLFNLNLDFPVLIFFTIFIYCFIYNKNCLAILIATFLIFSKENGIILYGLFLATLWPTRLADIYRGKTDTTSRNRVFIYLLPIFLLAVYFAIKALFKQSPLFSADHGSSLNILREFFTWNFPVIWTRLLEVFVLDFNWIATIFIALGLIKASLKILSQHFNIKPTKKEVYLIGIAFIFLFYLVISLFLFKHLVHPRYLIANNFFILLFFLCSLFYLVKIKFVRYLILSIYLSLIYFQNSNSLDPISNKAFGYYYFGSHKVISIDKLMNEPYGFGPRDALAFNLQYTNIDQLIRAAYQEMEKDPPEFIVTEDMDHPTVSPKIRNNNKQANIITISQLENRFNSIANDETGYYVHIPQKHDPQIGLKMLTKFFEITNKKEVILNGYAIELYSLKKLPF